MDISKLEGWISVDKIVSVNQYLIRGKSGRSFLTPEAKLAKKNYLEKLEELKLPKVNWKFLKVTFKFLYHNTFLRRDVSNCVKMFEDCLVQVLGLDDSKNIEIIIKKRKLRNKTDKERIYFLVEEFSGDLHDSASEF